MGHISGRGLFKQSFVQLDIVKHLETVPFFARREWNANMWGVPPILQVAENHILFMASLYQILKSEKHILNTPTQRQSHL